MTDKNYNQADSSFWQIIFPAIMGIIITIALSVLLVIKVNPGNVSRFAEISTVLLILPVLFFSVIIFLVLLGIVILISRVMKRIPPITSRIVDFLTKIQDVVKRISSLIMKLIIQPAKFLEEAIAIVKRKKPRYRLE